MLTYFYIGGPIPAPLYCLIEIELLNVSPFSVKRRGNAEPDEEEEPVQYTE